MKEKIGPLTGAYLATARGNPGLTPAVTPQTLWAGGWVACLTRAELARALIHETSVVGIPCPPEAVHCPKGQRLEFGSGRRHAMDRGGAVWRAIDRPLVHRWVIARGTTTGQAYLEDPQGVKIGLWGAAWAPVVEAVGWMQQHVLFPSGDVSPQLERYFEPGSDLRAWWIETLRNRIERATYRYHAEELEAMGPYHRDRHEGWLQRQKSLLAALTGEPVTETATEPALEPVPVDDRPLDAEGLLVPAGWASTDTPV